MAVFLHLLVHLLEELVQGRLLFLEAELEGVLGLVPLPSVQHVRRADEVNDSRDGADEEFPSEADAVVGVRLVS